MNFGAYHLPNFINSCKKLISQKLLPRRELKEREMIYKCIKLSQFSCSHTSHSVHRLSGQRRASLREDRPGGAATGLVSHCRIHLLAGLCESADCGAGLPHCLVPARAQIYQSQWLLLSTIYSKFKSLTDLHLYIIRPHIIIIIIIVEWGIQNLYNFLRNLIS